jgi:diguanylate cyclase (GGDEF)-like protein
VDKLRALIIEDDRDTAQFFKTVMDLVGFHCETVFSAREALTKMATSVPDLVLLDMRLGQEIGGADILYQIRSNPRFDNTRVIVITAHHDLVESIAGLADLALFKPVSVEQLKVLAERVGSFEAKPKRLYFRDPVTGLYNQDVFYSRLELALTRTRRRSDFHYAVMVIQFHPDQEIIDADDPEVQVAVLKQIANRLEKGMRSVDMISRFSGWKFAVILEDLTQVKDIRAVLARLREILIPAFQVKQDVYTLGFTISIAAHDQKYENSEEILLAAEEALEGAIKSNQQFVIIGLD